MTEQRKFGLETPSEDTSTRKRRFVEQRIEVSQLGIESPVLGAIISQVINDGATGFITEGGNLVAVIMPIDEVVSLHIRANPTSKKAILHTLLQQQEQSISG
jgi:hypothetical protein